MKSNKDAYIIHEENYGLNNVVLSYRYQDYFIYSIFYILYYSYEEKAVDVDFLDFCKAFNTDPHSNLLDKFFNSGMSLTTQCAGWRNDSKGWG